MLAAPAAGEAMGTFSPTGNEYDAPEVPAEWGRTNLRKAFMRGWRSGIWNNWPRPPTRYILEKNQAAYEAGFNLAQQTRRQRHELVRW